MFDIPRAAAATLSVEDVRQFLYREARFLDDKEWQSWLELYAPDAEYWMPSWDDDDQLVTYPQTQISLIGTGTRAGWKTESSASGPGGPVRPARRSPGHRTTSATSRS